MQPDAIPASALGLVGGFVGPLQQQLLVAAVTGNDRAHACADGHTSHPSTPEPVLELEYRLDEPEISPDGRWLANTSEEAGTWGVHVQPFRRPGERVRVSVEGGGQPAWRGDGRELIFRSPDRPLMAVDVEERAEDSRIRQAPRFPALVAPRKQP